MILETIALAVLLQGGSDDPTPYLVDGTGITLPAGRTFGLADVQDANIRLSDGRTINIHFPGAAYPLDGATSLRWVGLGVEPGLCIPWVQLHGFNEHHGEGGQDPACVPVTPEPPVDLPPAVDPPVVEPPVDVPPPTAEEPPKLPQTLPSTADDTSIPLAGLALSVAGLGAVTSLTRRSRRS